MKIHLVLALTGSLMASPALSAQAGSPYAGLQLSTFTYDEKGFEELEPTGGTLQLGYRVSGAFSVEGRLGTGLDDGEIEMTYEGVPVDVSFELDSLMGVYGLGHLPISDTSSVYGLIGWTRVEATTTASAGGYTVSDDGTESGLSYGIGAEVGLNDRAALRLEYTSYLDEDDFTFTGISVGARVSF